MAAAADAKLKKKQHIRPKKTKQDRLEREIAELEAAIAAGRPASGTTAATRATPSADEQPSTSYGGPSTAEGAAAASYAAAKRFSDLPLSQLTQEGLSAAKFTTLTAIQRAAIPHALCGRDILGAAKTGSGKTLAFLVPVLEKLYRERWNSRDGLGALVLTPTRELAIQIFDELRRVGRRHDLSAGLLIGGQDVQEEAARIAGINILVCTPGRLLQHMSESPGFDAGRLQVLVLDEADRILDMGFATTLNAIVEGLPASRQTMLFSATQTKSVVDLARLSLHDPEYLAVHAEAEAPTPVRLQQAYLECELHQKADLLWSFIRSHLRSNVIIFVSTCKQVKFLHEAFKKLRPGVPLRALHGGMSQPPRMKAYYDFCNARGMVMFATDVAARGLDFPSVDWVVQGDCPEDVSAYIHRVGRTARYVKGGRALLLLLQSEKGAMLEQLAEAHIPIKPTKLNPVKVQPVGPALQALLSKDNTLKELAERAVRTYLRSVFLQPNSAVFDVTALPVAEYAASMGLLATPQLRFLKRAGKKGKAQEIVVGGGSATAPLEESPGSAAEPGGVGGPANDGVPAASPAEEGTDHGAKALSSESEDDLMVVKRRNVLGVEADVAADRAADVALQTADAQEEVVAQKKGKKKKLKIVPGRGSGSRVVFGDDGEAADPLALLAAEELGSAGQDGEHRSAAERFATAAAALRGRDASDRAKLRELRAQVRAQKKARRKARDQAEAGAAPLLASSGAASEPESDDGAGTSDDDSSGTDEEADKRPAKRPRLPEPSHAGMRQLNGAALGRRPMLPPMRLAELEAKALQRLAAKR